jgi:hypothetical protein
LGLSTDRFSLSSLAAQALSAITSQELTQGMGGGGIGRRRKKKKKTTSHLFFARSSSFCFNADNKS